MRKTLVFVLITAIFTIPFQPVLACGPDYLDPVFGFTKHGEYPLSDYSAGKLGLIPNTYGRISLFVYYRYLKGIGLKEPEQKEVARAIARRVGTIEGDTGDTPSKPEPGALEKWMAAREKIFPKTKEPDQFKSSANSYSYYYNCLDSAFLTAIETLESRTAKGYDTESVKQWVDGQDAVFSNCGDDGRMPVSLTADFPEWLQKDRDYQIAAALFYQNKFADARNAFRLIAEDTLSPWNKTSRYLVARTFIREASLLDSEKDNADSSDTGSVSAKQQLLADAALELGAIENESEMKEFHDSAHKLLGLVKFRADPDQRRSELAERLAASEVNSNIFNDLTDYIWLLDGVENEAEKIADKAGSAEPEEDDGKYWGYRLRRQDVPAKYLDQELTDWLITFQSTDGFSHAFEKWQETKEKHWLAAAISKAKGKDESSAILIKAAENLRPDSTVFPTGIYHAVRLALESGDHRLARTLSDKMFASGFSSVPTATKNSFYAQRTEFASNLSEFLKYAKRTPTDYLWTFDTNESGLEPAEYPEVKQWKNLEMFGEDAVAVLNKNAPLSIWLKAAQDPETPDHLRGFIATAGWTRAVMLKDRALESAFAPLVAKYSSAISPLFKLYLRSRNSREKEAAALKVIGRYTVLEPSIQSGWGRSDDEPTSIDSIRGNWWCNYKTAGPETKSTGFLSNAEIQKGQAEYQKLVSLGEGATAVASRAVEFARNNPRNPTTPEILHLAVRSSRYGCTDDNTGKFSKAAFELLHTRYKNSVWTRRTPYWFN